MHTPTRTHVSIPNITDSDNPSKHQRILCKKSQVLFVDFSESFDSKYKGKMEQILLAYGLPKEIATAIMMLYRITKAKVRS